MDAMLKKARGFSRIKNEGFEPDKKAAVSVFSDPVLRLWGSV